MSTHAQGWYIAAPFLVALVLMGLGTASAYAIRAVCHPRDVEEERGAAGGLMIAAFASFLFAFIALSMGLYTLVVHLVA
jgi:hypothetical protein